jgi:hypothetical protein
MARPKFAPRKPGQPSVGSRRNATIAAAIRDVVVPDGICDDDELAELLGSLTGKEVKVAKGSVLQPSPALPVVISTYVDEEGEIGALLLADIAGAAGVSAALTLMSAGTVTEAMRLGRMDESLMENWGEVANIATQVVRVPGFPKYKLQGHVQSCTGFGQRVDEILAQARYRVGWSVSVPQYANGRLSLILDREE